MRNFKNDLNISNFVAYKHTVAKSKLLFRKKAKESWKKFCSSLNSQVNPSLIWKRAKSIRKGISHQNSNTMSAEEAEVMLKKLAPDWATLPISSTEPYYNHFLLEAITVAEFDACIKNHDTAPGIDGITYSMIGNLPRLAKELLCVAFNKIIQNGDDCEALKRVL
nr:unnamed protein product [Callosobruchus analis]